MNTCSIDEPFNMPRPINTPIPNEYVDPSWCEEPTVLMTPEQSKALIAKARRPSASSAITLPSMKAVVIPSAGPNRRPSMNLELSTIQMSDEPMAGSVRGALR